MYKKQWVLLFLIFTVIAAGGTAIFFLSKDDKPHAAAHPYIDRPFSISALGAVAYLTLDDNAREMLIIYDQSGSAEPKIFPMPGNVAAMDFDGDGKALYYTTNDEISVEALQSSIYRLDLTTGEKEKVKTVAAITMDLEAREGSLIYTRANEYKDVGGFTGELRSGFEAYELDVDSRTEKKLSSFGGEEITGIDFKNGKAVLLTVGQSVWQVPLAAPADKEKILSADHLIYDTTPATDGRVIYSMPKNGDSGVYDYELYLDGKDSEPQKITANHHSAQEPVLLETGELYYIVDENFGHGDPDYILYKKEDLKSGPAKMVMLPSFEEAKKLVD